MADGNARDATASRTGTDQAAGNPPAGADGHTAKLLADSQTKPGDATTVKDTKVQAGDKELDKVRDSTEKPAVDSYNHLTQAQQAANEIAQYVKSGKKDTDTVTVKGADGAEHSVKVADRVAELKKTVDTECATAVGLSNNIKQDDVAQLLQTSRNARNALAAQLKLDPNKLSKDSIAEARQNTGTTDSGMAAKLDQLAQVQAKVDTFKLWENAPSYTRMLYASFKANGLTDPETGLQKDKNGGLKASQKDVLDAVQLLSEAGTNKDLRNNRLYVEAVSVVLPKLENSSAKVQTITSDLQGATKAGAKGDKVEQERLLKDAVAQADQTNTAAIAQMLRDPQFVRSQRDPAIISDMANNVVMSSTARLQYAQLLADQGKFGDAQGLVLRVKTECPEVMYKADPTDPSKVNYQQSRFVDLAKLDQNVAASSSVQPNQIKNLLDDFSKAMNNGQIVGKDGVRGAHDILADMYVAANKKVTEVADGQKGLDEVQKQLEQRKRELEDKKYLTDGAKTLEQNQIDREQMMIKQQKTLLDADTKDANHLLNVVKLYDASLAVAEENRSDARSKLAEIKASDPELAIAKGPDGKDSFFTSLEKGSEEPGWWDRNWRKVAYGAAIVAGGAAGLATIWTGPGAALVAGGTTMGLMGAFGLAVGAGAVAGSVTYLGAHEALYQTGVVNEKVAIGKDLLQGASGGALGGFMFASVPLMAAAGAAAGVGAGAEATVVTGTATTVAGVDVIAGTTATTTAAGANAAMQTVTWGARAAQLGRMGAVSFAGSATNETVDHVALDHTWTQSIESVGMMTALPVAGAAAGPLVRGAGSWATRVVGLTEAAPRAAATARAAYVVPRIFTAGNLLIGTGQVGLMQGVNGYTERLQADALGPSYVFDENGNLSPIQNATSIFGPYSATRGWEANRQGKGDLTGERSMIQNNWHVLDPGITKTDAMAREKPKAPVKNSKGDFTDAEHLGNPDKDG